ncbi:MAG: glycosyltransferase family 2 protein [Acidimicrobiales bacterium]
MENRPALREAPLVSVVMAVYNGERFVGEALVSAMGQTWRSIECVVIDDGSTDGTGEVVSRMGDDRVIYRRQQNLGVSAARNAGLAAARGELVAFLDADDVWLPGKLAAQVECFRRRPELGIVFCGYTVTDEHLRPVLDIPPNRRQLDLLAWLMLEGHGMGLSFTGMAPRSVLLEVGGFNEELSTSADLDLATRIAARYPVDAVDDCLALYRQHPRQMHLDMAAFERDMLQIYSTRFAADSPKDVRLRRRASANLFTRLSLDALVHGQLRRALTQLGRALLLRPDRVLMLPAGALLRRCRQRLKRHRRISPG